MNCRERFLTVLSGKTPDRVPILATFTPQVARLFGEKLGLPYEPEDSFLSTRVSHTEMLLHLGNDAVIVGPCRPTAFPTKTLPNDRTLDEWGFEAETHGYYGEIVARPLSHVTNVEQLNQYNFPDPLAPGRYYLAQKQIEKYKHDYAIVGDLEASIFELAWNLTGMEKFIMDLATEEDYIPLLLDRIEAYTTACGLKLIEMGADMIWTGDDVGMQSAMLLSPALWRKNFKPRMKRMFQAFRDVNPNIKIAYHSCGCITPIISDLIEIGLDALNPLQPRALGMDLAILKERFGDSIVFFGAVDVQEILPHGTVKDVEEHVKNVIGAAGSKGGLIIAPAHNVQPDTPTENVQAFFNAVFKHGIYKA